MRVLKKKKSKDGHHKTYLSKNQTKMNHKSPQKNKLSRRKNPSGQSERTPVTFFSGGSASGVFAIAASFSATEPKTSKSKRALNNVAAAAIKSWLLTLSLQIFPSVFNLV